MWMAVILIQMPQMLAQKNPYLYLLMNRFLCYIVCYFAELKESNVNLKLTIVDTVGFGDQIDKTDRWVYIRYIFCIRLFLH